MKRMVEQASAKVQLGGCSLFLDNLAENLGEHHHSIVCRERVFVYL